MNRRAALLAFTTLALACGDPVPSAPSPVSSRASSSPPSLPAPILPLPKGLFFSSEMHIEKSATPNDGARIADVDACEGCHADAAAAWRTSAHAFASFDNPVYRVAVDRLRADRGNHASAFCAGCHDVALLVDGAIERDVIPSDVRAHAGVSCRVCHGITNATIDGNGSFTLDPSEIPFPRNGEKTGVESHRARVAADILHTNELCIACHRATLDASTGNAHALVGQDDATPYLRSIYAGSRAARIDEDIAEKNCVGCHMPKVASQNDQGAKHGLLASHEFLGGNTFVKTEIGDAKALARNQAFLRGAATIRVGAVVFAEKNAVNYVQNAPISISPGDEARLDLVVKNERVGHRFPGGVIDADDTWIEIEIRDAHGRLVADAGKDHGEGHADASAHVLAAYLADARGVRRVLRDTHEFATPVWNHSIAPRDAAVVSYSFRVPPDLARDALPLAVTAQLRHRTRNLALARAACDDAKSARGRAFGREGIRKGTHALDACANEPITEIDSTSVFLGDFTPALPRASGFHDAFDYALGLTHVVQERLDEAAHAFEHAQAIAPDDASRAMAEAGLADVLAKQGRGEDARAHVANAAQLGGPHPALARITGDSFVPTWEWSSAALSYAEAADASPHDDAIWSALATTRGGSLDSRGALDAAVAGLRVNPRDENLLRSQALALAALTPDSVDQKIAEASYLARRAPDDAPSIRAACSRNVEGCANERLAVHIHEMRQK